MEKEISSFIARLIRATKQEKIKWKQKETQVWGPYASHETREAESFFEDNTVILKKIKERASGVSGCRYILNAPEKGINLEVRDFHFLFSKPPLLRLIEMVGLDKGISFPYQKNISRSAGRTVIVMSTEPFPN